MVSKLNASSAQFRQLAHSMHIATQTADWSALKQHDLKLFELLTNHKRYLKHPILAPEIARIKQVHAKAVEALTCATQALHQEMGSVNDQHERAQAYQLAMTMEIDQ